MAYANVTLEIVQGEDYTSQFILSDQEDQAVPVTGPMQLDIKNSSGILLVSMDETDAGDGIDMITYAPTAGLIQLHLSREATKDFDSGSYAYDLFANIGDDDAMVDDQRVQVVAGRAIIKGRITELDD